MSSVNYSTPIKTEFLCDSPLLVPQTSFSDAENCQEVDVRKSLEKAPRQCVVCFEPTKCYHYDVPSCTGCKTFFRRSLITNRHYECQYGGNCDISNGAECRSCRFNRCLMSGMNAAAIQYPSGIDVKIILDHVTSLKRKLIHENSPVMSKMLPAFSQTKERQTIDFLLYLESKQRRLRESEYDPRPLYNQSLRSMLCKEINELSLSDKFNKPQTWPINMGNLAEQIKERDEKKRNGSLTEPVEVKYWLAVEFVLTIEVAKVLPAFNLLCLEDREALIQHVACVNMLITRSYYSYKDNHEVISFPNGVKPIVLQNILGRQSSVSEMKKVVHVRTVETIRRIAMDPEHFVLLKAIVYCHPAIEGLTDEGQKILAEYHEYYSKVLLHHVQNECGEVEGATKFSEIICLIETYFHFAEKSKLIHLMCAMERPSEFSSVLVDQCMQ